MKRSILMTIAATVLVASLGFADPGVQVTYHSGVPQIHLEGSYPRSLYTIYRAAAEEGPFAAITNSNTLCLGPCYAQDDGAMPGSVYWYRFDMILPEGGFKSFGPYAVTISGALASRMRASVHPNPSFGPAAVELFLAGSLSDGAVPSEAAILDLQGRKVRTLFSGSLAPGTTRLTWDGTSDAGRALPSGTYFLRFANREGSLIKRIVRVR